MTVLLIIIPFLFIILDIYKKSSPKYIYFLILLFSCISHILFYIILWENMEKIQIPLFLKIGIIIEFLLFLSYIVIRLNFFPIAKKQIINLRFRIMMGGRQLIFYSLFLFFIQIPIYIIGSKLLHKDSFSIGILAADSIFSLCAYFILFFNGVCRILCTSKRLNILRRVFILCTLWIPIVNICVLLYACRIVKEEYEHEEFKIVRAQTRIDSQICATKYPIVLVHGIGFRDLKYLNYWRRIPKELIKNGATIYYGHQEAWGTIEENAEAIKEKIKSIIHDTNCDKVNIIAHSKGGLDSRYMISKLCMENYVASLTTISTPHRGTKLMDFLSCMPKKIYERLTKIINKTFTKIGDKNPDSYKASMQLTTEFAKKFNEEIKDMPQVYYQSYTSVLKNILSDSLLFIPYCIMKKLEGENDGLVAVESAKWGLFKGVLKNKYRRGISHADMIDLKIEDYKGFDIIEKYIEIVSELKEIGF